MDDELKRAVVSFLDQLDMTMGYITDSLSEGTREEYWALREDIRRLTNLLGGEIQ